MMGPKETDSGLMRSEPANFKYLPAFLSGRPKHEPFDVFSLKHPAMDTGRRAKIFAPFDALRGFSEALADQESRAMLPEQEKTRQEMNDMCCRYYIERDNPEIRDILESVNRSPLVSRFLKAGDAVITDGEIHPTAVVPIIATSKDGRPCIFPMKWGFTIPGVRPVFNARVETASIRQSFREAWEKHRCIIPASYYFEWKHEQTPSGKCRVTDKYAIQPEGCRSTWLCGLYRLENNLPHFVILTRQPTEQLREIHNRMPLILPWKYIIDWVNPLASPEKILDFAVTSLIAEKTRPVPSAVES